MHQQNAGHHGKINSFYLDNNTKFAQDGAIQCIINPYDEWYALVRALLN